MVDLVIAAFVLDLDVEFVVDLANEAVVAFVVVLDLAVVSVAIVAIALDVDVVAMAFVVDLVIVAFVLHLDVVDYVVDLANVADDNPLETDGPQCTSSPFAPLRDDMMPD